MKPIWGLSSAVISGVLAWATVPVTTGQDKSATATSERQPVVVELFTSEGCSSCPPADSLLSEIDKRQPWSSAEVIAIEEHVDYWDQQGWKDPFSSVVWTERQKEYSAALRGTGNYTPEMVIDGQTGFIGSHRAEAQQEIAKAAAVRKSKVELSEASPVQNKAVTLRVRVEKPASISAKDSAEVVLAITESGLHSAVKAGENSGHELQHSPVLREMKVIGVAGKNGQDIFEAQPSVKLDSKWNVENLRAIIFVQEKKSRHILGAASLRLAPGDSAQTH